MNYTKHVVANDMRLCYAVCMFEGDDERSFVVATEKAGPIRRFALDGTVIEDVAPGPGGVMTVEQAPGRADQLLSTHRFFSPNFGADDAKIVSHTRGDDGTWECRTLSDLPYVHRFGVLRGADGTDWLIACTIKGSCRKLKDDWLKPGAVYVAQLSGDLARFDGDHQLPLTLLASQQVQNHGFCRAPDRSFALIGTAAGVFRYTPPARAGKDWDVSCLIVQPTSDMCLVDLDGDGRDEIVTIAPFHGDTLSIWHATDIEDTYERVWTDPERHGFLHAIWGGELEGEASALIGNRRDGRDLLRYYHAGGTYQVDVIDHDCGPANCWVFEEGGHSHIISANRETDEVALYDCSRH